MRIFRHTRSLFVVRVLASWFAASGVLLSLLLVVRHVVCSFMRGSVSVEGRGKRGRGREERK